MDDHRDLGIAVTDAVRLHDCRASLAEAFAARPSLDGDTAHWFSRMAATPGNEDWVHKINSRNVADVVLGEAVASGALPIWVRLKDGEHLVDPYGLTNLSRRTLVTGVYLTDNWPKANLEDRPLWVKHQDWQRLFTDIMEQRYGDRTNDLVASGKCSDDLPIDWDDFGPDAQLELQRLHSEAQRDEWWSWPEAIAYVGSRDARSVATLRYWRSWWNERGDGDAMTAISGQAIIAARLAPGAKADLIKAIQRGEVGTSGRPDLLGRSMPLAADDWRGSGVTFDHGVAILVSGRDRLTPWAFDVAIKLADLISTFPELGLSRHPIRTRAPSVKMGRPPDPDSILTKADEMKARGLGSRQIASRMHLEPGFDQVATTEVRTLLHGRWPPGRPRKKRAL